MAASQINGRMEDFLIFFFVVVVLPASFPLSPSKMEPLGELDRW